MQKLRARTCADRIIRTPSRDLGKAYQFVRGQRAQESGRAGHIEAFARLVEMLRRAQADAGINLERLTSSVQRADKMAVKQRRDLAVSQGEIRQHVATLVETLNRQQIESLASLPGEIGLKKTNRDLLRAKHAQEARSAMRDLMESAKGVAERFVDGTEDITKFSDLGERVLANLVEREQRLGTALDEARMGMEAYNARMEAAGQKSEMGAQVSASDASSLEIAPALLSYDDWSETYLKDAHARKSDAVMKEARKQLAGNVDQTLGLSMPEDMAMDEAGMGGSLEQALRSANGHRGRA